MTSAVSGFVSEEARMGSDPWYWQPTNCPPLYIGQWRFFIHYIISTEGALRRPMTHVIHPIPSICPTYSSEWDSIIKLAAWMIYHFTFARCAENFRNFWHWFGVALRFCIVYRIIVQFGWCTRRRPLCKQNLPIIRFSVPASKWTPWTWFVPQNCCW